MVCFHFKWLLRISILKVTRWLSLASNRNHGLVNSIWWNNAIWGRPPLYMSFFLQMAPFIGAYNIVMSADSERGPLPPSRVGAKLSWGRWYQHFILFGGIHPVLRPFWLCDTTYVVLAQCTNYRALVLGLLVRWTNKPWNMTKHSWDVTKRSLARSTGEMGGCSTEVGAYAPCGERKKRGGVAKCACCQMINPY